MTLRGHIRNGNVVLDSKVPLPEGAEVEVVVRKPRGAKKKDRFWDGLTVEELAAEQGVVHKPFEELLGGWPEEDLNDNFDEVVRKWRDEDGKAGR
ncbi:MAG TPA: hypothetical protein VGQ99_09570 [Tepidisphaeraceae bacterium]|jgi:hypothetical protein|nr:hypothetical protein [Tepidisphaeraceae bacterium]